ncbi:MAG: hypothetical protein LUF85_12450 [Bacteroides sp.]|nr:hypothetical protein [Bacteroides sp.]
MEVLIYDCERVYKIAGSNVFVRGWFASFTQNMYLSAIIHTMSIMRKGAFIIAFLSFCMAIQAQFAVFYDPTAGGYYLAEKVEDFLVPPRTYMNWGYLKEIKTEDNSNLCFTYRYILGMSSQDLVTDSWYIYRYYQDRFELIREGRDYLGGRFAPPHYKVKDYLQGTVRTSTDGLTWEEETFECQVPFGLERTVVKGRMVPLDVGL